MASGAYNKGKFLIANQQLNWNTDVIRVLLLNAAGYSFNADHNFVSDLTIGTNEYTGAGYTRSTLANPTVTQDNTNDRAVFDGDDVVYAALGTGAGGTTISAAVVYKRVGGDDTTPTDDPLIAYLDFTDLVCNGSPVTIQWSSSGLFFF